MKHVMKKKIEAGEDLKRWMKFVLAFQQGKEQPSGRCIHRTEGATCGVKARISIES